MSEQDARTRWARWMAKLARYHRAVVIGAEHLPPGGALVVGTHSLATYEIFIVTCFSEQVAGRRTRIVVDDLLFRMPGLVPSLEALGFMRGGREGAIAALRAGELIGVAPGGMRESLRPSRERYRYSWGDRRGFAAVALAAGVPIVPLVCPRADDIYTVYDNPLTRFAYRRFHVPVPVFHGRWLTPIPRPAELVFWMGRPIYADVAPDRVSDSDVLCMRDRVSAAVEELVAQALRVGNRFEGYDARPLGWTREER